MGTLTKALAIVVGLGLTALGGVMFVFTAAGLNLTLQADFGMELFLAASFLIVALAGVLLGQLGAPGQWADAIRRAVRA